MTDLKGNDGLTRADLEPTGQPQEIGLITDWFTFDEEFCGPVTCSLLLSDCSTPVGEDNVVSLDG